MSESTIAESYFGFDPAKFIDASTYIRNELSSVQNGSTNGLVGIGYCVLQVVVDIECRRGILVADDDQIEVETVE